MFNFLWFFKTKKKEEPENVAEIEADRILRKARKDASKYLAAVKKQCEVCANG